METESVERKDGGLSQQRVEMLCREMTGRTELDAFEYSSTMSRTRSEEFKRLKRLGNWCDECLVGGGECAIENENVDGIGMQR